MKLYRASISDAAVMPYFPGIVQCSHQVFPYCPAFLRLASWVKRGVGVVDDVDGHVKPKCPMLVWEVVFDVWAEVLSPDVEERVHFGLRWVGLA